LLGLEAKWVRRDREVARSRAAATHAHRDAIESIVAACAREPTLAVVFRTEDPFDLGRVDSARGFLAARLGEGFTPYLLASDARRSPGGRPLGDHLAALLRARAEGRSSTFRSWASYGGAPEGCLEVVFQADPRRAVCARSIAFPGPDPRLTGPGGAP
jgi:hypothetical protein